MVQFCDVPGHLTELVVGKVETLQRVHPVVGAANGQIEQLVMAGI